MKYLKSFENINENCYYKIIIDGSFEKFEAALYKLGILEKLLCDWSIEDFDDMTKDNQVIFEKDIVYLCLYRTRYSEIRYIARNHPNELYSFDREILDKKMITIYVTDEELSNFRISRDSEKYNL